MPPDVVLIICPKPKEPHNKMFVIKTKKPLQTRDEAHAGGDDKKFVLRITIVHMYQLSSLY